MPHWEDMHIRAKKMIEEGLMLLRTGAHDVEFLANTTASAAKLHMTVRKNQLERYRVLHDLGRHVFEASKKGGAAIPLTPDIKGLIKRTQDLDSAAQRAEKELEKFTVVNKSAPKKKPSKKNGGRAAK